MKFPEWPLSGLQALSIIAGVIVMLITVVSLMTTTPWFVHIPLIAVGLALFFGGLFNGRQ